MTPASLRLVRVLAAVTASLVVSMSSPGAALAQAPGGEPAAAPPAAPEARPAPQESTDEMEEDIFGKSPPPAPSSSPPDGAPGPARSPAAPPPRRSQVKMVQATEPSAADDADDRRPAFAIELETASFASGALGGGLFLGARLGGDMGALILGGTLDVATSSRSTTTGTTAVSNSSTNFTLGAGARYALASVDDGRVELFGAGDLGFVYRSTGTSSSSSSATGFSLAFGPGLRLWLFDHLAVGYVARFQVVKVSGSSGAADETTTAFVGSFQLLGVF